MSKSRFNRNIRQKDWKATGGPYESTVTRQQRRATARKFGGELRKVRRSMAFTLSKRAA